MRYSKTITIILCLFYISECIARIPTTPITLSEEYTFLELLADADRILNPQPVLVVSGERIDITTEENVRAASDVICCGEAAKAKGNTEADKNEEASKNIEDTESSSEHVVEQPTQDVDTENAALEERIKKMAEEAEKIKRDKEARAAITARAIDAPQHMNIVAMARRGIARTQNSQMRAQDTISINIATEDVSNKRSDISREQNIAENNADTENMLKKLAEEADKIKCDKKARAAVLAEENIQHKIEASLEQQRLLQKSIRQKRG